MKEIRAFQYRLSRQSVGFRVEFATETGNEVGQCRNISSSGLQAQFNLPLEEGTSGRLTLHHPKGVCEVGAVVKRTTEQATGLEFRCETPEEEQGLAELLGFDEKTTQPATPYSLPSRDGRIQR